jgi:hypothetical protein
LRTILLILSDTHGGHKFGLLNPAVTLYDETPDGDLAPYSPEPTAFQEMLLELLTNRIIPEAVRLAGDDPVLLFHLGDMCHGVKHPEQLVSTRIADQIEIAVANLYLVLPAIPTLKAVRLIAGTGAHELGEGSAAIIVASRLAAEYPALDIRPLIHGLADVNGCLVDYAHHGPGASQRIWLEGNTARFYLRDIMLRDIVAGRRPPDLVLRGHIHVPVNEVICQGEHESRLLVCPSMCGLSDFAIKVTRSTSTITVGAALVEVIDGRPSRPILITESFDIRTKEDL